MTVTRQSMSDEQRKSVALEYFKFMDNGAVAADGHSMFTSFDERAQAYFPKWGLARRSAGVSSGPLLRCVRDSRFSDPAGVYLSGLRLRVQGHSALSVVG